MAFYVKVEDSKKLCYPLEDVSQFDSEQLTAIRQLQIRGLAQVEKRMIDGKTELVYAVGGMQPLSQYMSTSSNRSDERTEFVRILENVLKLIQEIEKYPLLSVSNLITEMDNLWVDAKGEVHGIYLPLIQDYQNPAAAWKKLIQDLLGRAESDDGLLFLTRQMRFVEGQSMFSVTDIQKQIYMDTQSGVTLSGNQSRVATRGHSAPEERLVQELHDQPQPPFPSAVATDSQPPIAPISAAQPRAQTQTGRRQSPRPNIHMMQAPDQPSKLPYHKDGEGQQSSAVKASKYNVPVLIIGHVVIVLITVGMVFGGLLKNEAGGLDIINAVLLAVIVIAGLVLIWLKLAVISNSVSGKVQRSAPVKAPKAGKQPKGKAPGMSAPVGAPGMNALPQPPMQKPPVNQPPIPKQQSRSAQPTPQSAWGNPSVQQPEPVFFEQAGMREAEGTMILSGGVMPHAEGTVMIEQESGAFLSLKKGEDKRKVVKNPFRIGRNADWKLSDSAVSGMHCQVEIQDGKYYLVDIGSKNGTFLNGKRLEANQYQLLNHGDEIKLGNSEIIFEIF